MGSPGQVAQFVGASILYPRKVGLIPSQGTYRVWGFNLLSGGNWSIFLSHIHVCLCLSVPFSPSPSLLSSLSKTNEYNLWWGLKICIYKINIQSNIYTHTHFMGSLAVLHGIIPPYFQTITSCVRMCNKLVICTVLHVCGFGCSHICLWCPAAQTLRAHVLTAVVSENNWPVLQNLRQMFP